MRYASLVFTIVLLLLSNPAQSLVVIDSTLASACSYYLSNFDWGCGVTSGMKVYKCGCDSVNFLGSIATCIMTQNDNSVLQQHAMRHVTGRCKSKAGVDITVDQLNNWYENATSYVQYPTEENYEITLTYPISTNTTAWEYYHQSFKGFAKEVEKSQWFGWGLVFFWTLIIIIAAVIHWSQRIWGYNFFNTNYLKRHFSLVSTVHKYNETPYYLFKIYPICIPTRMQTLIITAFLILTIISCCFGYTLELPNPMFSDTYSMTMDLVSYRTDMMAISLFPVIYMFGIRNNPFIPITGLSFASFNVFHKFTAVVMCSLAFVHSIIWTVEAIKQGGYLTWYVDYYYKLGVAAMIGAALMLVQSIAIVRIVSYEVFLLVHKLLAILFIWFMYQHCVTLGWLGWIWSMAGILCFDRFIRIVRIVLSGGIQTTKATSFTNSDVIKLELAKPKLLNFEPGSYAYIYFLSPWYLSWQSHPFTVITSPVEGSEGKLIIYFKAKKGITKQIIKYILKSGTETSLKVIIEGPYGVTTTPFSEVKKSAAVNSANHFGLCAGLGIVSIFPHFKSLVASNRGKNANTNSVKSDVSIISESDLKSDSKSSYSANVFSSSISGSAAAADALVTGCTAPSMTLYWVINDICHLEWFASELNWLIQNNVDVMIFVTGIGTGIPDEIKDHSINYDIEGLQIRYLYSQRPDLQQLVMDQYIQTNTSGQKSSLIVYGCGPASFNDSLRHGVVETLNTHKHLSTNLDLHLESFTW